MQRIDTEESEQNTTTIFIKNCALLWGVLVLLMCLNNAFDSSFKTKMSEFVQIANGIMGVLILILPFIMFLAIILTFAQRLIDKW